MKVSQKMKIDITRNAAFAAVAAVRHKEVVITTYDDWNICGQDGKYKDVMNRTNNGLERYNRRFNGLFDKQPSLMEFVEIVEKESRMMAQRLEDIRKGREGRPSYKGVTIPEIPEGYDTFKKNAIKKAKKAKRVAAAAAKKAKKA